MIDKNTGSDAVDLDKLEAKARAATRGQWYRKTHIQAGILHADDANYMAALDPTTVLALIAQARAAAPFAIEYGRIVKADERAMRAADALDGMGFTYDEEIGWLPPKNAAAPAATAQAAEVSLPDPLEIDWPELNSEALGCGVEDREIRDRYQAAEYGWECAIERAVERVPDEIYDGDQLRAYGNARARAALASQPAPVLPQAATDKGQGRWQVQIRSEDKWKNVMAWDHGHTIPQDTFSLFADAHVALATMEEQYEEHSFRLHLVAGSAPTAPTDQPKDTPESMANSNARFAIDGAIAFGREGVNKPPSEDHWLYEYWSIGQQLAKLGETSGWDNVTPLSAPTATAEPVAYLHQVVCGDGEPDQALSFAPDNFPLSGTLGYRSLSHQALYVAPAPQQAAPLTDERIVAWVTFGTKDGKKKLDIGSPTTNPDYVKAHKEWLWEPLVRASSAASAGDATQDDTRSLILGQAVAHYGCVWPAELWTGVMHFNGQRITKAEFDDRAAMAATKEKKQ